MGDRLSAWLTATGRGPFFMRLQKGPPACSLFFVLYSLFNRNALLLFNLLGFLLRNEDLQDTILEFGLDIGLVHVFANIVASLAGAVVALAADKFGLFFLLFLYGGLDGQVAILQIGAHVLFLKSGELDIQLVAVLHLLDIRFHLGGDGVGRAVKNGVCKIIYEIVPYVVSKNAVH